MSHKWDKSPSQKAEDFCKNRAEEMEGDGRGLSGQGMSTGPGEQNQEKN